MYSNEKHRIRDGERERATEQKARERKKAALLELTGSLNGLPQDVGRHLMQQLDAPLLYNKCLPQWLILSLASATIMCVRIMPFGITDVTLNLQFLQDEP